MLLIIGNYGKLVWDEEEAGIARLERGIKCLERDIIRGKWPPVIVLKDPKNY